MDWECTDLDQHYYFPLDTSRSLTRISTLEHRVLSIWTLAVVGDLRLRGGNALAERTARRRLTWICRNRNLISRFPKPHGTYSSLPSTPFHSNPTSTDTETRSLGRRMCHCSSKDSMHIRLVLIKHDRQGLDRQHSPRSTLITRRSDKARITFTRERVRAVRNASTMLITNIRRANYIDNRHGARRRATLLTLRERGEGQQAADEQHGRDGAVDRCHSRASMI